MRHVLLDQSITCHWPHEHWGPRFLSTYPQPFLLADVFIRRHCADSRASDPVILANPPFGNVCPECTKTWTSYYQHTIWICRRRLKAYCYSVLSSALAIHLPCRPIFAAVYSQSSDSEAWTCAFALLPNRINPLLVVHSQADSIFKLN